MGLLIDTQLLIWGSTGARDLSRAAVEAIEAADAVFFSVASLWEVAIKQAKHKPGFDVEAASLRAGLLLNAYVELPVEGRHALAVADLPAIHGDPFDRLLVAQAWTEGLSLLTSDRILVAYGPPVRLV